MTGRGVAVWRTHTRGKGEVILIWADAERGDNIWFAFHSGVGRAGGQLSV